MEIIKSYLMMFGNFSKAYSELKSRYQDEVSWVTDTLKLVEKGKPVFVDGELLAVNLEENFLLIGCENFEMMIADFTNEEMPFF